MDASVGLLIRANSTMRWRHRPPINTHRDGGKTRPSTHIHEEMTPRPSDAETRMIDRASKAIRRAGSDCSQGGCIGEDGWLSSFKSRDVKFMAREVLVFGLLEMANEGLM